LVNLRRLLERLQPLLAQRAIAAGIQGDVTLSVDGQRARIQVRPGWVGIGAPEPTSTEIPPDVFFRLLFGSTSPELPIALRATTHSGKWPVASEDGSDLFSQQEALSEIRAEPARVLSGLFPRGAPVYWRTDIV
jgi:hypothetical protein